MAGPRRRVVLPLLLAVLAVVAVVGLAVWRLGGPSASSGQASSGLASSGQPSSSRLPSSQPSSPTSSGAGDSTRPATPEPSAPAAAPIDRVVAISVDGLNPRAIAALGTAGAPAFHRLMREGAWTFNARTEWEQTRTLPNHTGMLTGRRIDAGKGGHGVTFNTDKRRTTVDAAAGHYVASVFDVVHDRGGTTAMFANKEKFALFERTWNLHGAPDQVGADNGRAKIDRYVVDTDAARLVAGLNEYLRTTPGEFVFVHLALPDQAGHDYGFMSERYLAAVRETDRLLGSVLDTIADDSALSGDTLVLVTADHGGAGARSHSDPRRLANFRVPFFAWGPGVTPGGDLYQLNPGRRNPGDARITYQGPQPIRNGDLANLATGALGLPPVPGSQFGAGGTERLALGT